MMTIEIESDLLKCIKYAIWLIISSTYHFLRVFTTACRQRPTRKPCYNRETAPCEKFETRNLQRHRAALSAIARLSCFIFLYCTCITGT